MAAGLATSLEQVRRPAGTLSFGAVTLELLIGPENRFGGIGHVRIGATQIRGAGQAWSVGVSTSPVDRTGTADLVPYQFWLVDAKPTAGGVDLLLNATIAAATRAWTEPDELVWSFRSVEDGFRYSTRWRSRSGRLRAHKLLDRFSFGLNGTVDGHLWATQREVYNMRKGNRPSTAAAVLNSSTVLPGWDYPAQRVYPESRAAAEDPLDFLSARTASFARYPLALGLIYKNLSRPSGSAELLCDDWHVSTPSTTLSTTVMVVRLFEHMSQLAVGQTETVNAYFRARDAVHDALLSSTNASHTARPLPAVNLGFGKMGQASPVSVDEFVGFCKGAAIKRVWVWSLWITDWTMGRSNVSGALAESDAVWFIDFDTKNYNISALAELGHALDDVGIDLILWLPGGHLSVSSPLRAEHEDWPVCKPGGSAYTYVYKRLGSNVFANGFADYLIESLRARMKVIPFKGVFLDSFQVMGVEPVDYCRGGGTPNLDGAVSFVRRLQEELGLVVFAETNFPLTLPFVAGEFHVNANTSIQATGNAAWAISGREWVAYKLPSYRAYQQLPLPGQMHDPIDPATYFRLLAVRSTQTLSYDLPNTPLGAAQASLGALGLYANHAYAVVEPHMNSAQFLDGGAGVVWRSNGSTSGGVVLVAWAFRASNEPIFVEMPEPVSQVLRLTDAVTSTTIYHCEVRPGGILLSVPQHRVGILAVVS